MLQNVRDKMKGTLVATVVMLFIVGPLVLTGVGSGGFLGSVAGTDAANVDGKNITHTEVRRAVYRRRQQLLAQQNVDESADYLKEENLRGPILNNLTERAALLVSAESAGIGAAESLVGGDILKQEVFHVDGKFDAQTYRRLLANSGYTPATYKVLMAEDFILRQQSQGLSLSAFTTEQEIDSLVALVRQKRSFSAIKLDAQKFKEQVSVADEEVSEYYEKNAARFIERERVSIEYVELTLTELEKEQEANDDEVRLRFDEDVANFVPEITHEISHLLVESKDGVDQASVIAEITAKLGAGEDFMALVSEYSDDSGTKALGGSLGVLTSGIFPEAFEDAAYKLEQGEVSEPVSTDAGIHFIKLDKKTTTEVPAFEERKLAIERLIKEEKAQELYGSMVDQLLEVDSTEDDLAGLAESLGLTVKTSGMFGKAFGPGIASNAQVRNAAFSDDALVEGLISADEVGDYQTVAFKVLKHEPEHTKDLSEVKSLIQRTLEREKLAALMGENADALIASISEAGAVAKTLAEEMGYEYSLHDLVERAAAGIDTAVMGKAFSMGKGERASVADRAGNHYVLEVSAISLGGRDAMPEQQLSGLVAQVKVQGSNFESSAYQAEVVENADIEIY